MKKTKFLALALAMLMSMSMLSACGGLKTVEHDYDVPLAPGAVGRVVVSVNPEVGVDYDENGEVVDVEGLNEDGEEVSEDLEEDYTGKEVRVVVGEIVGVIYEDGYFETTVNGVEKNIVVKVTPGSELPSDDFVEVIAGDIRVVVDDHGGSSTAVTVGLGDYNLSFSSQGYISSDKAEEIALAQGDAQENGQVADKDYDLDDGIYEIEYLMDGKLIQADVDAVTGKVMNIAERVFENVTGRSFRPSRNTDTATDDVAQPDTTDTAQPDALSTEDTATTYAADGKTSRSKSWEDWGESIGDAWEHWGESYGNAWENWGEDYGNGWEKSGESAGDSWESWGESYGDSWESWGEDYGNGWEKSGESAGDSWESWGESYGNGWESWGESIGDYFDDYWDF